MTRVFPLLFLCACGTGGGYSTNTPPSAVSEKSGTRITGKANANTQRVDLLAAGAGGAFAVVATGTVSGSTWSAVLPAGNKKTLALMYSAAGLVIGGTIVESKGDAGGSAVAPPMNEETRVEAMVFESMVRAGASVSEINTVDVRRWIDASLADAVRMSASPESRAASLAEAIVAAQRMHNDALGGKENAATWFDRELTAAMALNVALDAGTAESAARAAFETSVDASAGSDLVDRARVAVLCSAAFYRILFRRVVDSGDAFFGAATRAAALREARAVTAAVTGIYAAADGSASYKSSVADSGTTLVASLNTGADGNLVRTATSSYVSTLLGGAATGALGDLLKVTAAADSIIAGAIAVADSADLTYGAAVLLAAANNIPITGTMNIAGFTSALATASVAFDASVAMQASEFTALPNASGALQVIALLRLAFFY